MYTENTENTAAVVAQEKVHEWTKEEIDTIKNTVAKGANNSELKMFLSLASAHGLNPFNHEIWFVKMGSGNVIITARDGYLKIANNSPHFLGLESDAVYSGDKFAKNANGIIHEYNAANRGHIIGAYAVVHRDDRKIPAYFFAPFNDYNKRGGVWNQYPHAMIVKVAEAMALKRAFAINGLVTQEEMGYEGNKKILTDKEQAEQEKQQALQAERERSQILLGLWKGYLAVCDNQPNHAQNAMKKVTGKATSKEFTDEDIAKLFEDLARRQNEQETATADENSAVEEAQEEQPAEPEVIDNPEVTD